LKYFYIKITRGSQREFKIFSYFRQFYTESGFFFQKTASAKGNETFGASAYINLIGACIIYLV